MKSGLTPGATNTYSVKVTDALTVPQVSTDYPHFPGMPSVFATGYMVAFAESACMGVMAPYLEDGEDSVGTAIDMDHTAATPVGLTVTATATLTSIEGRSLIFDVVLRDDAGVIGQGTHRRAVIDRAKFDARVAAKAQEFRALSQAGPQSVSS